MGVEENKATLQRYYDEVMNKGNMSLLTELMDEEYYLETPTTKTDQGYEAYKQAYETRIATAPDAQFSIDEMIAEGDAVSIRGYLKGTYTSAAQAPGTENAVGKQFNTAFAAVYYFKDGKISKCWTLHDVLTRYQQLGITPPAG